MPARNIVVGQPIDTEKLNFAKQLRRTMTLAETKLWSQLRGRKLGGLKFRRQQIIDGYIADFYCSTAALVIELDGPIHESQLEYDALRDRVLVARGLRIIRVPNSRINDEFDAVLKQIVELAGREPDLTPRPPLRNGEGEHLVGQFRELLPREGFGVQPHP